MIKFVGNQSDFKGKAVLLRADLDEPHDGAKLLDDYRIQKAIPTIDFLRQAGAKVIILSKLGRPKKSFDPAETLMPAAERLAQLLGRKLVFADSRLPEYDAHQLIFFKGDIRKKEHRNAIKSSDSKDIILLENVRFYPEEENCDPKFAKELAELGDIFVFDAFAMAHRTETSVTMLPKYLPAYGGLELQQELYNLNKVLTLKVQPFLAIMGGAKISDKVETIRNLGQVADNVLIGGALANLFFLAQGLEIGKSYCEKEKVEVAKEFLRNFKSKLILPEDVIVAELDTNGNYEKAMIAAVNEVRPEQAILDIGPKTILNFSNYIKAAKKMLWNGPLGLFEKPSFSTGTMSIGRLFAARCKGIAFGIAGGGDTLEAINQAKIAEQIDFVSTGGGAMLQYFGTEPLPAIQALEAASMVAKIPDHLNGHLQK